MSTTLKSKSDEIKRYQDRFENEIKVMNELGWKYNNIFGRFENGEFFIESDDGEHWHWRNKSLNITGSGDYHFPCSVLPSIKGRIKLLMEDFEEIENS